MRTYTTSEIAKIIKVHPNTVMLYEKWGYISSVERKENGYRIYTEKHLEQIKIVRLVQKEKLIKCYMKLEIQEILRSIAKGNLNRALKLAEKHLLHIENEKNTEIKIITIIEKILNDNKENLNEESLNRSGVAKFLNLSIDKIINWERNGMIEVPRNKKNGYREYSQNEIRLLKVIKVLRKEDYSTQCIVMMINKLKENNHNMQGQMLSSLDESEEYAKELIYRIKQLIKNRDEV